MGQVRAVGFDYLGVTANLPADRDVMTEVANTTGATRDEVMAAYLRHNRDFQLGHLDKAALWRKIAQELGAAAKTAEILSITDDGLPRADERILELADALRAAGYRVGLLSNLAPATSWSDDLYAQGVDKHFDAVGLSGAIGYAKPDPRAFRWLTRKLGVETGELVFIDDRAESVIGVEALGVEPIIYQNTGQLHAALESLGVKWQLQ